MTNAIELDKELPYDWGNLNSLLRQGTPFDDPLACKAGHLYSGQFSLFSVSAAHS
jgi:hypothetical protein